LNKWNKVKFSSFSTIGEVKNIGERISLNHFSFLIILEEKTIGQMMNNETICLQMMSSNCHQFNLS